MKKCLECGNEITSKDAKKFCGRSCSAKYTNRTRYENGYTLTTEQRKSISDKLKISRYVPDNKCRKLSPREIRNCKECNIQFETTVKSTKIYCSPKCGKKNLGGYRNHSGRSKSGYYKGIYCGSTYELCWVIYNLDHNIPFTRFEGMLVGNDIKYIPDFLLDDKKTIIEIKGYEFEDNVNKKTQLAESYGYKVIVLRKNDLKYMFNYVKINYTHDFKTLYDDYKPKYEYVCNHCGNTFHRDKKSKTEITFCSRQCSGKGHIGRNINGINQYNNF